MKDLLVKLSQQHNLSKQELMQLIDYVKHDPQLLLKEAHRKTQLYYGTRVFIRGLIEFSSYCKQNCLYCGLRRTNKKAQRYRLTEQEILDCYQQGYSLGIRSFVLQSGEDVYFTDEVLSRLIREMHDAHQDIAIALSIGERSYASYKKLYEAGAERFLLRHETANRTLYQQVHPSMSYDNRRKCLINLRKAGFAIGAGFLIGLPGQTTDDLIDDLLYLRDLQPEMVGIGPFIPHPDTPLGDYKPGTVDLTIIMVALARLLLPKALIPATTAVSTLRRSGRGQILCAGANVVMPNLTPSKAKAKYEIYKNKAGINENIELALEQLKNTIKEIGLTPDLGRGDPLV